MTDTTAPGQNELRFDPAAYLVTSEQLLTLIQLFQPLKLDLPAALSFMLRLIGCSGPVALEPFSVELPGTWQVVSDDSTHRYYDAFGNLRLSTTLGADQFVDSLTFHRRLTVCHLEDGFYGVYDNQKHKLLANKLSAVHACIWLRYLYPRYDDPTAYWNKRLYPHWRSAPLFCAAWYGLMPR